MSFWQQLVQLLSESPANVVFHLLTLFAIQATLALVLAHRRRGASRPDHAHDLTWRLLWAATILLATRLILLLVLAVLALRFDTSLALGVLPPLEQAINSLIAITLVWLATPPWPSRPDLVNGLAILLALVVGGIYIIFARQWPAEAAAGLIYNQSIQSSLWGILQLFILIVGLIGNSFLWFKSRGQASRPDSYPFLLPAGLLLVAHLIHFWNYPELIAVSTEIPYWIRLGQLIALPLLAVLTYRYTLAQTLANQLANRPSAEQFASAMQLSAQMIRSLQFKRTLENGVNSLSQVIQARFVAIGMIDDPELAHVRLMITLPAVDQAEGWLLRVKDWPSLRLALEQLQPVELSPNALGGQQLLAFYRELGIQEAGALLIEPLLVNNTVCGLLLLVAPAGQAHWLPSDRVIASAYAAFLAQAISNSQRYEQAVQSVAPLSSGSETFVSGRVIALENEREQLQTQLTTLTDRLQLAERNLISEQQRVKDLTATIEQQTHNTSHHHLAELEAEIAALKQSLIDTEEAMALAAAGDNGLSTNWVMMTISRYSAELEEAQIRMKELETKLNNQDPEKTYQIIVSLVQELRTPLTSIAGYTDLILGEMMGILGAKQREFLTRVRANVSRMGDLLDQIVQLSTTYSQHPLTTDMELIDIQEIVESALSAVITQIRKKELQINLHLPNHLPKICNNRDALYQVLIHLLNNACQASASRGYLTITARADALQEEAPQGKVNTSQFVHLAVGDSGEGIAPEDRPHVFDMNYRADHALIKGLGETGIGLSVAHTLVTACGGRMWVDSQKGKGSTFSLLLPAHLNGHHPAGDKK